MATTIRTRAATFLAVMLLTLASVGGARSVLGAAGAGAPIRLSSTFDETHGPIPLSGACGFEVFVHLRGISNVELAVDPSGTVSHELDTIPSFKVTFFAPSTGKAIDALRGSVVSSDYLSDGTARNTITGTLSIVPAAGARPLQIKAGRIGTINAINDYFPVVINGRLVNIPITGNTIEFVTFAGISQGTLAAAVCPALGP